MGLLNINQLLGIVNGLFLKYAGDLEPDRLLLHRPTQEEQALTPFGQLQKRIRDYITDVSADEAEKSEQASAIEVFTTLISDLSQVGKEDEGRATRLLYGALLHRLLRIEAAENPVFKTAGKLYQPVEAVFASISSFSLFGGVKPKPTSHKEYPKGDARRAVLFHQIRATLALPRDNLHYEDYAERDLKRLGSIRVVGCLEYFYNFMLKQVEGQPRYVTYRHLNHPDFRPNLERLIISCRKEAKDSIKAIQAIRFIQSLLNKLAKEQEQLQLVVSGYNQTSDILLLSEHKNKMAAWLDENCLDSRIKNKINGVLSEYKPSKLPTAGISGEAFLKFLQKGLLLVDSSIAYGALFLIVNYLPRSDFRTDLETAAQLNYSYPEIIYHQRTALIYVQKFLRAYARDEISVHLEDPQSTIDLNLDFFDPECMSVYLSGGFADSRGVLPPPSDNTPFFKRALRRFFSSVEELIKREESASAVEETSPRP